MDSFDRALAWLSMSPATLYQRVTTRRNLSDDTTETTTETVVYYQPDSLQGFQPTLRRNNDERPMYAVLGLTHGWKSD